MSSGPSAERKRERKDERRSVSIPLGRAQERYANLSVNSTVHPSTNPSIRETSEHAASDRHCRWQHRVESKASLARAELAAARWGRLSSRRVGRVAKRRRNVGRLSRDGKVKRWKEERSFLSGRRSLRSMGYSSQHQFTSCCNAIVLSLRRRIRCLEDLVS